VLTFSDGNQCFLHFALGKAYADIGDHERAFAHYRDANSRKMASFDGAAWSGRVAATIGAFDADALQRRAMGDDTDVPVFVVGMPRSGTSLVEQVLASHPAVFGAGELRCIAVIAASIDDQMPGDTSYPACLDAVPAAAFAGFGGSHRQQITALAPDARRVIDKNPLNFEHLGLIARLFPRARIIHCRRDPRDVAVSCYFQNFTAGQEWAFDLADIGAFYRGYRRLMDHWRAVIPLPLFEVDYEDMVDDLETTARRLVDFLGLDWHPACLDFHSTERAVRTASQWQVRRPIYASSARRWQCYADYLEPFVDAAGLSDLADPSPTGSRQSG
jgi:hypothetical protein